VWSRPKVAAPATGSSTAAVLFLLFMVGLAISACAALGLTRRPEERPAGSLRAARVK
jgi:hypothetical protein